MRKFSKKAFSLLLTLAMVFSLFSVSAYAQTPEESEQDTIQLTVVPLNGDAPMTYDLPVLTEDEGITPYGVPPQQQHTFNKTITGMTSTNSISFVGDRLTSHVYVGNSSLISFVKVSLVREYWYGSQEIVYTHVPINTESMLFFSGLQISARENYHITVAPNVSAPSSPVHVIVTAVSYYGPLYP